MSKTLVEILEENNVSLISSGSRYKASCPFHDGDREPSFTVYPTGTYFCFGCEAWGDAVKFLVEYTGMSTSAALEYCGIDYKVRKTRTSIKIRGTYQAHVLLFKVAELYHRNLLMQSGAIQYLLGRGLTYETISGYKLGYTDGHVLHLSREEEETAQAAGLINNSGYESLHHRITIPNLVGGDLSDYMVGRTVIHDNIKYLGVKMPKPIFGMTEVWGSPIVFVAEGQFDWLILRQWGFPAVIIGGTHISKTNLQLLKHKKVIVVPDCDEVGIMAAVALQKSLPDVHILDYTEMGVKDVAEAAEYEYGEAWFSQIVGEQEWITSLSNQTLARWLPSLLTLAQSH